MCQQRRNHWDWLLFRTALLKVYTCAYILWLKCFYNTFQSKISINHDKYLLSSDYVSARRDHTYKVKERKCRIDLLKMPFFQKTINEWNKLLQEVVSTMFDELFTSLLWHLWYFLNFVLVYTRVNLSVTLVDFLHYSIIMVLFAGV